MKILFLHPNFPAQFCHLAAALGADPQHQVAYITARENGHIPGVKKYVYKVTRETSGQTHKYVRPLEEAVSTGQAAWRTANQLKEKLGFEPDVIYAHIGWGPGLFMCDLFPQARYIGLFEWYYHAQGADVGFDPDDPADADNAARIHISNAAILLELSRCDAGIVPTHWQKQQFPPEFHHKLYVLHDGIDLEYCRPDPGAKLVVSGKRTEEEVRRGQEESKTAKGKQNKGFGNSISYSQKTSSQTGSSKRGSGQRGSSKSGKQQDRSASNNRRKGDIEKRFQEKCNSRKYHKTESDRQFEQIQIDELVTYVARGMEPYRGFPQFMAAVEKLLKMRPHCHVMVVGEDRVAYGKALKDGRTYKEKALAELDLDLSRVHFRGRLPHSELQQVYRASSVHVYWTYPFVLSWSMLEAMASSCVVLGSKTAPVEEVIRHGENGFLVDFWDVEAMVTQLNALLDGQNELDGIRQRARQTIAERYDLAKLLPQQIDLLMGKPMTLERPQAKAPEAASSTLP